MKMKTKILTGFLVALFLLSAFLQISKANSIYVVYVYDSWGAPIAGANVTFYFWNDPMHDTTPILTIENVTDSNGQTSCTNSEYVPNGLNVTKEGYVPYYQKGNILDPVTDITLWGNWTTTDWTETAIAGQWRSANRTEWQATLSQEDGVMNWTRYVVNFTGYHAQINFTQFRMERKEWWWMFSDKDFFWCLEINGSAHSNVIIQFTFHEITNTWGLIKDKFLNSKVAANDTSSYYGPGNPQNYWEDYNLLSQLNYVDLYVWRDGNNMRVVATYVKDPTPILLENYTFALSPDFWQYAKLSLYFKHTGYGYFTGGMNDVTYFDSSYSPSLYITTGRGYDFWGQIVHDLSSIGNTILPKWLLDWVGQITSWGSWLLGIMATFFSFAVTVVPMIPMIVGFYVLDAGIRSVHEGSFEPIGYVLQSIYGFVTQIIGVLVAIAQTIYDFIHFW